MEVDGVQITGITADSRKVKEGYAFVAIEGIKDDGNEYIDEAIKNGAKIIYTEKDIELKKVPVKKVPNSRIKLAELLNLFYDFPSEDMFLIGVTGTNGKTTTTHLIDWIFRKAGYKTGLIGTAGIKIKEEVVKSFMTTPEPETLFSTLANMKKEKVEVAILEVSSHALKLYRTYGLEFDVAIHTNIKMDHINFHKTLEDYIKTKKMLFDSLKRGRVAILNIDDKNAIKLVKDNDRVLTVTYGFDKKATLTASSLNMENGIKFNLCLQRGIINLNGIEIEPFEMSIFTKLIGKHNVYNILASAAVSLYFGISPDILKDSIKKFRGVSRRLERIHDKDFLIIDDYSHNPASYEAVFEAIQNLKYNKIIIVNAIRGNRGIQINKENAEVVASWLPILGRYELILSLSEDIVSEKDRVDELEKNEFKQILDRNNVKYKLYGKLEESIKKALSLTDNGDIVLLLGAQGMDKGREIIKNNLKQKN
ncbi:Mur ligase family protein [Thermohalobacter berrensis]|uniref:UDP-N-acetylmuramyl peptide synthase n=1 Tax=Thermohalobacter berrensis TaxID=99594 RepID=A0A419T4T7_9FIRM|nr:UDP-N-acetylmuramyl-tripeptide synthetase [Thermohalobacter berrensis]RKD32443.1 UDP-N-acetylmuramyl peptide synthase [Thermohalobacter berrensis]